MKSNKFITSISIGVKDIDYQLIDVLSKRKIFVDYITIDVAHGHSILVEEMVDYVKSKIDTFLIVGNICTVEAVKEVEKWGANAIKVGIGGGCFIGDTEVITTGGAKKIEDIEIGDKVLTHLGRYKKVIEIIDRIENNNLLTINESITCTNDHDFYVLNKKYKDIVNDDNIHLYAEWVSAKNLSKKYFLLKIKEE